MPRYETYTKVKEVYSISAETLRNWARRGQIRYKCIQNTYRKTWLFDMESIGEYLQQDTNTVAGQENERGLAPIRVVYLRVSSSDRADELERERELLQGLFPDAKFITDTGSGIDFHRPGFTSLVRQICRDQVSQVVVTSKDRVGRFLWDFFEFFCKEHSCSILVHSHGIISQREEEIKNELFEVIGIFTASRSGIRAASKRDKEAIAQRSNQGQAVLEQETEEAD